MDSKAPKHCERVRRLGLTRLSLVVCHHYPTDPFTNLESLNPWVNKVYVIRSCRSTDFEAQKLVKGGLGS